MALTRLTTLLPEGQAETAQLASDLVGAMGTLRRKSRRRTGTPFGERVLSGSEVELVRLVRRCPHISVTEAAAELGLAANTVSTLVGRLLEAEVLVRESDPADRRQARLSLTPAARRRVERWRDERVAAIASAVDALSPRERAVLTAAIPVITRVAAALEPADA